MSIISRSLLFTCVLIHTCSVTSESDRETCYSRQHRAVTVNIRSALTKGTVMIPRERPLEKDCILTCCSEDVIPGVKCNLVVYKPVKESSGENCYLFNCPSEQDCPLMTAEAGFNTYNIFRGSTHPTTKVNGRTTAKPLTTINPQLNMTTPHTTTLTAPTPTATLPITTTTTTTTLPITTTTTTLPITTTTLPITTTTTTLPITTTTLPITTTTTTLPITTTTTTTTLPITTTTTTTTLPITTTTTTTTLPITTTTTTTTLPITTTTTTTTLPITTTTTTTTLPLTTTTSRQTTTKRIVQTLSSTSDPSSAGESSHITDTHVKPQSTYLTNTTTITQPTTTTTQSTSTVTKAHVHQRPAVKPNRKLYKAMRGPETHSVKPPTTPNTPTTTAPTSTTITTIINTITTSSCVSLVNAGTPAVLLEIESKQRAVDVNKPRFSRMMWKNSLVVVVVLTLIFLLLILALVARKAMESFDRRHYTRLELNDLHYEV